MIIELLFALGISALLGYLRVAKKSDRFNISYSPTNRNKAIITACPSINKEFTCSVIPSGHLSTLLAYFNRPAAGITYTRTLIDVVAVDWLFENREKLVLIVPGLFSDSHAPYISNAAQFFFNNGFDVGIINVPGCGTRLRREYAWFDMVPYITEVMDYLAIYANYENIFLVGFSNGGNSVINYISLATTLDIHSDTAKDEIAGSERRRARAPDGLPRNGCGITIPKKPSILPTAVVTISQNFNAREAYKKLHPGYDRMFATSLRDLIYNEWGVTVEGNTMFELEKQVTCRQFGFVDPNDMFDAFSCYKRFHDIACPTLVIVAIDDPITGSDHIPYHAIEDGNVIIAASCTGGHMGWRSNTVVTDDTVFPDNVNAADQLAAEFMCAVLSLQKTEK